MKTRNSVGVLFILLLLWLLFPIASHARLPDISVSEWSEFKQEEVKENSNELVLPPPVVSVVEATPEPDPGEFYCMGAHLDHKIFWIPAHCLARGLGQVPISPGQELFCKHGYLTSADEYAVVPTIAGDQRVSGWDICWELVQ